MRVELRRSEVECRTLNRHTPGSNPHLLPFRRLGIICSFSPRRPSSLSCINGYLDIDSGGNGSEYYWRSNCSMAELFPEKASWCRNGDAGLPGMCKVYFQRVNGLDTALYKIIHFLKIGCSV